MYLLLAFAYRCIASHIPPLIPFLPLITYQYQLLILILFLSFLRIIVILIGAEKMLAGSGSYISMHLLRKLSIQVIMYDFERTNQDTQLDFFISMSFHTLFVCL